MSRRSLTIVSIFFVFAGSVSLATAQTSFEPPRLPDGKPDLQGVWDFRTLTPLERPENLSDKAILGDEETAEIEANSVARSAELNAPSTDRSELLPAGGNVGATTTTGSTKGRRWSTTSGPRSSWIHRTAAYPHCNPASKCRSFH